MPSFSYIAHSMDGKVRKGSIDASDMETAREMLRKNNVIVEEMHQSTLEDTIAQSPLLSPTPLKSKTKTEVISYVPLIDTMRLYAGWLLAWYSVVYLLGSYQATKQWPFEIPFIGGLFLSPLILTFAFGTYLFLLLTSVHRWLGRGLWRGVILAIFGFCAFVLFTVNM